MAQIRLTEERCYELFREYETPKHVIAHCRAVCDVSVRFAEELNAKGFNFDISLVRAAGLIHDLVRLKKPHDKEGAKVLRSLGYFEEADIVEDHMGHQFPENLKDSTESDMVVLADRLVCENEFVGLERRIKYLKDKYGNIPEVNEKLDKGAIRTRMFMNQVEEVLGKSIDSLFAPGLDEILKQVEKPAQ